MLSALEYVSERKKRRILNRRKFKRLLAILVCIYAIGMMVNIVVRQENMKSVQKTDYQSLTDEIEQIRLANEDLELKIEFAKTDAYIERIARDQLGYVKEGEIKFVTEP